MNEIDKKKVEEFEKLYAERNKNSLKFCQEMGFLKNEQGVYIYKSSDGNHSINIVGILTWYAEWLIE